MIITDTLAFSLAKFCYARSQHRIGAVPEATFLAVCDELAAAVVQNDNLHDMTRNERAARYGWHPRDH